MLRAAPAMPWRNCRRRSIKPRPSRRSAIGRSPWSPPDPDSRPAGSRLRTGWRAFAHSVHRVIATATHDSLISGEDARRPPRRSSTSWTRSEPGRRSDEGRSWTTQPARVVRRGVGPTMSVLIGSLQLAVFGLPVQPPPPSGSRNRCVASSVRLPKQNVADSKPVSRCSSLPWRSSGAGKRASPWVSIGCHVGFQTSADGPSAPRSPNDDDNCR